MASSDNGDDWVDVAVETKLEVKPEAKQEGKQEGKQEIQMPLRAASKSHNPKTTGAAALRFYRQIKEFAQARLDADPTPIFRATIEGDQSLYDTFIQALPSEMHQEYSCNACRKFVNRFGNLSQVTKDGNVESVFWSDSNLKKISEPYRSAVAAVNLKFKDCRVQDEFKVRHVTQSIGVDKIGGYHHIHMVFSEKRVIDEYSFKSFAPGTTFELSQMLERIINDYKIGTVRRANKILEEHKLPQASNHQASARWLLAVLEAPMPAKEDAVRWHNFMRRTAAVAFIGCLSQLRNGALSTLLNNLEANESWKVIEEQWTRITDPIQYLRPQAAPKSGNIAASERLFEQMGLTADDMRRRFLVFDDVPKEAVMWKAPPTQPKTKLKIFANVEPKDKPTPVSENTYHSNTPATKISFAKFVNKILPQATKVEYRLQDRNSMSFLITSLAGNKPLMQWHDETTIQASWYFYHNPFEVSAHNLKPHAWNNVTALIPLPHLWDGAPLTTTMPVDEEDKGLKYYHAKNGLRYMFCMEGIIDKHAKSLALFATLLKGPFHGARATIEAYSNEGLKEFVDGAEGKGGYVGGPVVRKGKDGEGVDLLRVTDVKGEVGVYEIVLFD